MQCGRNWCDYRGGVGDPLAILLSGSVPTQVCKYALLIPAASDGLECIANCC
jgi:hypothetical protein